MSDENSREDGNLLESIYNQDCEFYRHQNELKWQRFTTVTVLEAGILYGLLIFNKNNTNVLVVGLAIAGIILVFLLSLVVLGDLIGGEKFLERIKKYEASVNESPLTLSSDKGFLNFFDKIKLKGNKVLIGIYFILNILNIVLLLSYAFLHC